MLAPGAQVQTPDGPGTVIYVDTDPDPVPYPVVVILHPEGDPAHLLTIEARTELYMVDQCVPF